MESTKELGRLIVAALNAHVHTNHLIGSPLKRVKSWLQDMVCLKNWDLSLIFNLTQWEQKMARTLHY